MKQNIQDIKKWLILIIVGIFTYWGLNNISILLDIVNTIYKVFLPFILGGILAFILNIPMSKIESFLKKHIKPKKKTKDISPLIRIISIILSLLLFLVLIAFVAFLLIPELIENIELLINNIPILIDKVENVVLNLLNKYPDIQTEINELFTENNSISNLVSNILNYFVGGAINFITNLVSGFITLFTAIIFAIYMLTQKEYLLRGTKKVIYAKLNKKHADKLLAIGSLSNKTFSKFISGQCVEAVILGCIIFLVAIILRFPYALIIAVLTAITALIPVFGAFIAMIVGAILIAITNPIQAVIFIIAFLIIQQIEGNFIYPKVVGASVGLSPMWTLLAITVGGNLFGITGMLIGLPLASVIYALVKSNINKELKEKEIKIP